MITGASIHNGTVRDAIAVLGRERSPRILIVAGSDSGGGAGIQADLKTFAALGVHGTSAITCLTAQNPKDVLGIQASTSRMVNRQIEAVFAELKPSAVKTGMLFSGDIIRVVAEFWNQLDVPLIVDPVMVSTSGVKLLKDSAVRVLQKELLPLATLVTPNLSEAEILVGEKLSTIEDLRSAAKCIRERFGCASLVKGGHLRGGKQAIDIFYDGKVELILSAPYVKGISTHGTGCTYSAAIAAYVAQGLSLEKAVGKAKEYISNAIAGSIPIYRHSVLNHFPKLN
ncbi:MAG: bifunctional hydroxymethylpyrimidine kinase/phosphomethylpyrimidine kinase [Limisphaerales bacterium]